MAMDNSIPPQKPLIKWLLIAVCVLSLIVLGLCSYAVHIFRGGEYLTSPLGFMMFCCIWTWLVVAAFFLIPRIAPQLYNKWIMLGFLGLSVFFWLIAFALLAARVSDTSVLNQDLPTFTTSTFGIIKRSPKGGKSSSGSSSSSSGTTSDDTYTSYNSALTNVDDAYEDARRGWRVSAASAGIGALIWILLIVVTVFFGLAAWHHHQSTRGVGGVEAGEPKPMPPAAPVGQHQYGSPPPPSTTTPNPDQQFAQQPYGGAYDANQQQYGQYPQQQQYPQQSHHIPS